MKSLKPSKTFRSERKNAAFRRSLAMQLHQVRLYARYIAFPKTKRKVRAEWKKLGSPKRMQYETALDLAEEIKRYPGDVILALKEEGVIIVYPTQKRKKR